MDALYIDVSGVFNSFREPNAQRYQRTLLLPPPTTIAGFFCAAIGWERVDDLLMQAGVNVFLLKQRGFGKDLWKYHKKKPSKDRLSDVLFREFQYGNSYRLFLFGEDKIIKDFAAALENPAFALTLGSSEELVNVKGRVNIMKNLGKPIPLQKFQNTILPGDYRGRYKPSIDRAKLKDILYNLTPPEFIHLPVLFEYDKYKGRTPKRIEPLTFSVGFELGLKNPIDGFQIDGISVVPCGPYNE